jgi:UDP-N-acetylmuramoylalanine--D-glutamate ligase
LRDVAGDKILGQVDKMTACIDLARSVAKPGDSILLSPGFASFDLFKNEFDRGDQFNQIVSELKK